MDYPEVLTYEQLTTTESDFVERVEFSDKIDTFYRGGRHIEKRKGELLEKRLDEDIEIYRIRLKRFCYTNILASLMSRISGRFNTGEVFLSGLSDSFLDDWALFREDTNGTGRDEQALLSELLKALILHQDCHVQVDKPLSAFTPLNRAQELQLGLKPQVLIYKPYELLSRGDGWYKFFTLEEQKNPFSPSTYLATWRFVDSEAIAEYQEVVELRNGKISAFLREGDRVTVSAKSKVALTSLTPHGFDRVPVVSVCLPDEHYAAGQVYLKLLQHLRVENALTDTALSAGYIQRVLTPVQQADNAFDVPDPDSLRSDNAHILKAQSFKFEEITGSSIRANSDLLENIERQVETMVCISGGSTTREALVQSAASKKVDVADFELFLRSYGRTITSFYQDILQLVGQALGDPATASVSVTGLDSFDLDSLDEDIERAIALLPVQANVAPDAVENLYIRISQSLSSNTSAAERERIAGQVSIDRPTLPVDPVALPGGSPNPNTVGPSV